ncbi:glycine rich domain-containing protein [Paenibacillus sp. GCM10027627]|uniref:glycine rich domain-containing protein n=1 Tax=unclassified Paenibacillus TaxID=185978 RepID=UPI003631A9AF
MKQLRMLLLVFLILMTSFPFGPKLDVEAATGDEDVNKSKDGKPYRTGAWFDDGELVFVTPNKKASSKIRYGTKAFVFRADETCNKVTNNPNRIISDGLQKKASNHPDYAQCAPLMGESEDYLRIDVYDNNGDLNKLWNVTDTVECSYHWWKGCSNEVLVSKFTISKAEFETKLSGHKQFMNWKDGQTVYMNTIFRVINGDYREFIDEFTQLVNNGTSRGDTPYNQRGIYRAQDWADKSYFRNYYDVTVDFYGSYPLKVKSVFEDDQSKNIVSERTIVGKYGPPYDTRYEAGMWPAWRYSEDKTKDGKGIKLDKTIVQNGKTYVLKCSYVDRIRDPVERNCSKETGAPGWVRNSGPALTDRDPPVYVGGTQIVAVYGFATCKCDTTATIPNKTDLEGEVPPDNEVIGKKIGMQIDFQQGEEDLKEWEEWVKGKSNFQIHVELWRPDNEDLKDIANNGTAANWTSKDSKFVLDKTKNEATTAIMEGAQLIKYMKGGAASKLIFEDDLTNYPIPEGKTVSFKYNARVRVLATDEANLPVEIVCVFDKNSTVLTWFRPMKPKVDEGMFFSVPKYYSEIKEGSPQTAGTSSNEAFDAMSGTPTTRSLYFAAGGSEFIVDVQVEYVPKFSQKRTYKSVFNAVTNGHALDRLEGGWQNDSPPPAPAPRTVVDMCDVPFTESVTPETGSYTKGYDSRGNPIPGVKYRWIQNGHSKHSVGPYEENWEQTVTFDYMKIDKAIVWKIERSKVTGMATLVNTSEVTAGIRQGNPNWFYNRAENNTSADGRLRYSEQPTQHDAVIYKEGDVDNCISNSITSGDVIEQDIFNERKNAPVNVTAISDFLILQTSSGDQSVMYFQKTSNTAKTTENLEVEKTDFDTMWTNNPLSAAKWNQQDTIKVGSYNGLYGVPQYKYSPTGGSTVTTIFDTVPAGRNRPARPAESLRIMEPGLDIPNTLPNGEYTTGFSSVFYRNVINDNPETLPTAYPVQMDGIFNEYGLSYNAPYSPIHSKVNDVVIHNPVSVQNALVKSLPDRLDQRVPESKAIGGNKREGVAEYERILNPNYRQNIIPNPDAEIVNVNGTVAGWNTWANQSTGVNFTHRGEDEWLINGKKSFEINTTNNPGGRGTNYVGVYYKDIQVRPNAEYAFEGKISCHRCNGYFYIDLYDSNGNGVQSGISGGSVTSTSSAQTLKMDFNTTANVTRARIHIVKGNSASDSGTWNDHMFADDLKLSRTDVQEFVAVDPVAVTQEVANPDYQPAAPVTDKTFEYTNGPQTFTAPGTGTYTFEVWGAQGSTHGAGGKGGYSKGTVALNAGEILHIYVGGATGYNGGGSGHGRESESGGGASDVRRGGDTLNHRIIVAGGGGGPSNGRLGGAGGGETGGTGEDSYGTPGTGGTQSGGGMGGSNYGGSGTFGQGGSNHEGSNSGGGGGGGGWYGGGAGGSDYPSHNDPDDSGGGGGSGYIGGVQNGSMQSGVQSGNGKILITAPALDQVGQPTKIITTVVGGSDTSPPSDAYILKAITVNPNAPAGGFSPGKFILLDYEFQLYFPNTGDFYGNGQWGWSQTTEIRGKGFKNDMDTTEWTKSKHVKFGFNVIYNNKLYKADEWIPLEVSQINFDFYAPLANREQISATVEWKSEAINSLFEDNDTPTNKVRYDIPKKYAAKHSTLKKYDIDVVGRIGNMAIEDTGDFRFSNLFKKPLEPTQWLVPNVVKRVNPNIQLNIVGDTVNIRGEGVSSATDYLNTWGLMGHMDRSPIPFPLTPDKNNINALKRQPLRLGYGVFSDIQTMGNYYSNLQITPYYYHLNLQNGAITPVDIHMKVNGTYKPINKHGAVQPGWNSSSVHSNPVTLNWEEQQKRRNVTIAEADLTNRIAALFAESGGDGATGKAAEPYGNYMYGSSQFMKLTGRNRTYIGQDATYSESKNPGNVLSSLEYAMQAQRWHYTLSLPSSAVAVKHGQPASQANIDAFRKNTGVLIMAADILSVGDTYTLQYKAPNGNGTLNLAGTSWPLTSIPYPVIGVYSSNKSSSDDLDISGTH